MKQPHLSGWLDGLGGNSPRETRWLTPKWIVEALGHFDLDPAGAPGHDLAARTYTPERGEDGLKLPWEGRVWLNPPYGREQIPFMERMVEHDHGTALLFAAVETKLWHELIWPRASAILFPLGRFTFARADGVAATANSGKPSALIAYGPADAEALASSGIPGKLIEAVPTSASKETP